MRPYQVNGVEFRPKKELLGVPLRGVASWYGEEHNRSRTDSGEEFNDLNPTISHKTLPMDTMVLIRNIGNNRSVKARVNDRGLFISGIDFSMTKVIAQELDITNSNSAVVEITVLGYDGKIDSKVLQMSQNKETPQKSNIEKNFDELDKEAKAVDSEKRIVQNTFQGTDIIEEPLYIAKESPKPLILEEIGDEVVVATEENISNSSQPDLEDGSLEIVENIDSNSSESDLEKALENEAEAQPVTEVTNIVIKPKVVLTDNREYAKVFYVQVASFGSGERAELFKTKNSSLLPNGLSLKIKQEGDYHKVWVSGFRDSDEAKLFNNAKEYFPSSFLVQREERVD
jgi:rare lipoprotein A